MPTRHGAEQSTEIAQANSAGKKGRAATSPVRRRIGIAGKIALWAIVFGTVTALGVAALMYRASSEAVQKMDGLATTEALKRVTTRFATAADRLQQDTLILSEMPPVQGILRAQKNGGIDPFDGSTEQLWRDRLAHIFTSFLEARSEYFQIRFISSSGKGFEIVRVERLDSEIRQTPEKLLQAKSGRDYFKQTLKLRAGQAYLSDVNLNRERGQLEIPHRPTIRATTPVYDDEDGELSGMIVINANARKYFSRMATLLQSGQTLVVANAAGDYLYHPDASRTFGFDLGERHLIQDEFPAVADVKDTKRHEVVTGRSGGERLCVKRVAFDRDQPERFITVGVLSAGRGLGRQIGADSAWIIFTAVAFILGGTVLAVIWSRFLTRSLKEVTAAAASLGRGRRDVDLSPIRNRNDETGDLARAFGAMADEIGMREAKMREQSDALAAGNNQLTRLNAQLSAVMETAIDGLIVIDEAGTVQSFNPAAERMFGYKAEEVIGQNVRMLMPEPYRGEHDGYLRNYVETGKSKIIGVGREVPGRRKDGSVFPIELGISPMRVGNRRLFLGMTSDISRKKAIERKKEEQFIEELKRSNEELMQARAAAEEATAAKSEFLANMTHELRTPLNSIVGFSGLLAESPVLSPKDRRFAKIIDGSSQSLLALVNDILDFSSLEAGAVTLRPAPFSLPHLVENIAASFSLAAEEKGLKLKVERGNAVGPAHLGDALRLHQVLLNLVNNAVKFTPEGSVTIALSAIEQPGADQHIRIEVRDTGIGIAPDKVEKMFGRFAQADASIHNRFGGTGLGLAISKRLVEMMGGTIGMQSAEGKGTTVWLELTLPCVEPAALTDRGATEEQAVPTKALRILVADDVDLNRDLVTAVLTPLGHRVDEATDGAEAIEAVKAANYDLVLMDIQMPGMDGLAATRAIRAMPGFSDLPIVAMTAQGLTAQCEACREAGMDDYLAKPITPTALVAMLDKWTGGSHQTKDHRQAEVPADLGDEFLARCARDLARVKLLLTAKSPEALDELRKVAHDIAGMSAMAGYPRLSADADELSGKLLHANSPDEPECAEALAELEKAVQAA